MRLPPLNALRAFEAAARHGGFVGAAEELNVTRGAISRHVKGLEDDLGTPLFLRHAQGVDLTEAGRDLLPALTEAFAGITGAVARVAHRGSDLRVLCGPAMSIRWLLPRLGRFQHEFPDIRVRLVTDFLGVQGFDASQYDLAFSVSRGPKRAPEIARLDLFPILLSPACAPTLLGKGPALAVPSDLARHTLLHETTDRVDWSDWRDAFGVAAVDQARSFDFQNLDIASRAAVMGSGIVMADLMLNRDELETGQLVLPFPDMICASSSGAICLLGHRTTWGRREVRRFRDWAAAEAALHPVPDAVQDRARPLPQG